MDHQTTIDVGGTNRGRAPATALILEPPWPYRWQSKSLWFGAARTKQRPKVEEADGRAGRRQLSCPRRSVRGRRRT